MVVTITHIMTNIEIDILEYIILTHEEADGGDNHTHYDKHHQIWVSPQLLSEERGLRPWNNTKLVEMREIHLCFGKTTVWHRIFTGQNADNSTSNRLTISSIRRDNMQWYIICCVWQLVLYSDKSFSGYGIVARHSDSYSVHIACSNSCRLVYEGRQLAFNLQTNNIMLSRYVHP